MPLYPKYFFLSLKKKTILYVLVKILSDLLAQIETNENALKSAKIFLIECITNIHVRNVCL